MKSFIGMLLLACTIMVHAQKDPEFPKGWVMYLDAQQGISTRFNNTPDLYVFSLGISPQWTLMPGHLRLGGQAAMLYENKNISSALGFRFIWKIKTFNLNPLGSLFNLQLQFERLWGIERPGLYGAGPVVEAGQLLTFSFMVHRDSQERTLLRTGIGFNLLHKKRKSQTGTDPLRN